MFSRFVAVGSVATAFQYVIVAVAGAAGSSAAVAGAMGYLAGSGLSYTANRRFTFGFRGSHARAAPRFYAMVAAGFLLTVATMALLADTMGWNLWLAQGVATGLCLVFNYACSRLWVFREGARCPD